MKTERRGPWVSEKGRQAQERPAPEEADCSLLNFTFQVGVPSRLRGKQPYLDIDGKGDSWREMPLGPTAFLRMQNSGRGTQPAGASSIVRTSGSSSTPFYARLRRGGGGRGRLGRGGGGGGGRDSICTELAAAT